MTPQTLLLVMAAALPLMGGCAWYLYAEIRRNDRLVARLASVQESGRRTVAELRESERSAWPVRLVTLLGTTIARSGLLSTATLSNLEHTLTSAGFRRSNGLGLFVGCKLLSLMILPTLAWIGLDQLGVSPMIHHVMVGAAAIGGLLLPDFVVKFLRRRYLAAVEDGMPDALDMLVICSDAGLGLEPSITRVAQEVALAHPAVGEELSATASELRISSDTRTALLNAGARTGLDSIKRLGGTLVQTMQYGTPLSQALRTLSAEMRQEALTRFEEKASRLPVLLTLPMIIFILPCVFMVVGGPAVLQVMSSLMN